MFDVEIQSFDIIWFVNTRINQEFVWQIKPFIKLNFIFVPFRRVILKRYRYEFP